jgi:hypothetical protein
MMRGALRNYIFIDTKLVFKKSTNCASHPIIPFYCILILKLGKDLHHRCLVWTTGGKARGMARNGLLPKGEGHGSRALTYTIVPRSLYFLLNIKIAAKYRKYEKGNEKDIALLQ